MRISLVEDAQHATEIWVLHQALHFVDGGLLPIREDNFADEFAAHTALFFHCWCHWCFRGHYALPAFAGFAPAVNSCARKRVFTRARSFLASRRRLSASACPVLN